MKLFLLDAMALIYRAYFALNRNPRINSKGLNTSAVLGFANTLYDILQNEKPTHIGIAFDTFAPTLREADFAAYKAQREKMPEDIATALPFIRKLIQGFNIPILEADGYEADDVIGTLARRAEEQGFEVLMVTPDKDFGQLVTEKVKIYKPPKGGSKTEILGIKEVCDRYGIENPAQVIDILGLWGDASDNIPGIPGIGEKRAMELVARFGSVEDVIANADQLKGKMQENVREFAEQGLMSKQLATIITDAPIDFDPGKLVMDPPDEETLKALFEELEFKTFARRVFPEMEEAKKMMKDLAGKQESLFKPGELATLETSGNVSIRQTSHDYKLVEDPEQLLELVGRLKQAKSFCFDTETTGIDPNDAELVGISFAFRPGEAFFVLLPPNYNECLEVMKMFKPFLEDEKIEKTGQNLKYDMAILKWYDIDVKGKLFDTMLAHYLIEPDIRHNMDFLAETYLNYTPVHIEELIGKKGKNQGSMRDVDKNILTDYACEDADITLQLRNVFEPMLEQGTLRKLFDEIEMPLVPVLASMEAEGVKIDTEALDDYSIQLGKEIKELEIEIFKQAGAEFNIASPRQLGDILYDKLKITDRPPRTPTKQYSTSEDVLSKLLHRHPMVQMILDYRSLTKLKSTYVDVLPTLVSKRDRRIHTSYNQAVAATGRLSSNNPNLQNIPIRTERGREIRKAFVPRNENHVLLSADYSQIELRIIAELSEDPKMIEAFTSGVDIHTATAARVFNVALDQVTREMRSGAKAVNFGIAYGMSAFGLSERLNIPRREAADIIENYFATYPGIRSYMDQTIAFAREHGYVETMMGRRRYLRDINSRNGTVRAFAERNAINAPIQGSSADMIKIAMIRIFNDIRKKGLKSKMILQVHDELVFDVHKDEVEAIQPIIEEHMKNAIPMKVPIIVEMSTGENWLEAH